MSNKSKHPLDAVVASQKNSPLLNKKRFPELTELSRVDNQEIGIIEEPIIEDLTDVSDVPELDENSEDLTETTKSRKKK